MSEQDPLVEIKRARAARPDLYPADFDAVVAMLEETRDEVERLQRFEAMFEDCARHRDQAERRARRYMDIVRQVAELVAPDEDEEV